MFAGPVFAWVAVLVAALIAPPPIEAADRDALDGPWWRWQWTRARRALLLYGIARAALLGILFWSGLSFVLVYLLTKELALPAGVVGAWFGFGPLSLLGGLMLRSPSQAVVSRGAVYGALAGFAPSMGLLTFVFLMLRTGFGLVGGLLVAAVAILTPTGFVVGVLVASDLINVYPTNDEK